MDHQTIRPQAPGKTLHPYRLTPKEWSKTSWQKISPFILQYQKPCENLWKPISNIIHISWGPLPGPRTVEFAKVFFSSGALNFWKMNRLLVHWHRGWGIPPRYLQLFSQLPKKKHGLLNSWAIFGRHESILQMFFSEKKSTWDRSFLGVPSIFGSIWLRNPSG